MEIRSNYGPKKRLVTTCGKGRCHQAFKEECDINNIMKKYRTKGILPSLILKDPQYGDFANVGTFQESLEVVAKAHSQFEALPALVRKRFDNDPGKFLEFATDSRNMDEMVEMGLAIPKEEPEKPMEVIIKDARRGKIKEEEHVAVSSGDSKEDGIAGLRGTLNRVTKRARVRTGETV